MVAAMIERETAAVVVMVARDHHCPSCGGYLGSHGMPAGLPQNLLWARLWCPQCKKWRRVDLAAGRDRAPSRRCDVLESA